MKKTAQNVHFVKNIPTLCCTAKQLPIEILRGSFKSKCDVGTFL